MSNYMRQKLIEMQGEIDKSTIIVGDFSTPLSEMDRSNRQKVGKDIVEFNSQLDIMEVYTQLHPTTIKYILFSSSHGTFIKKD